MGRAAIYCRISIDREGKALGVERQESDCRRLAERYGHTVVQVFIDNDTGASRHSKKRRPAFEEMIALAEAGHLDVIISWSTSRLTRRPLEHERLMPLFEERHIAINTVKAGDSDYSTARGRRRAREDAARDAEEVEEAAERIRAQKIQAAMSGEWRGGRRPYGYGPQIGVDERNGKPIIDGNRIVPDEAQEIVNATRAILQGASLRSLAADLNLRQKTTSTGKRWTATELRRVLLRGRNAGLIEVTRPDRTLEVVGSAKWPAIVSEQEWRAVCAILSDPDRRTNRTNTARKWIGSGLYRCGVCDGRLRATSPGLSGRTAGSVYRCLKKVDGHKVHVSAKAEYVDELVESAVVGRLRNPKVSAAMTQKDQPDVAVMQAEAVVLRRRLDEADDMFTAGELDRRRLAKITVDVRAKLVDIEAKITAALSVGPLSGIAGAPDVAKAWRELDVSRRQAVIDTLCEVVLLPSRQGRPKGWKPGLRYFDPNTVQLRFR